jgi:hypothetical protein
MKRGAGEFSLHVCHTRKHPVNPKKIESFFLKNALPKKDLASPYVIGLNLFHLSVHFYSDWQGKVTLFKCLLLDLITFLH